MPPSASAPRSRRSPNGKRISRGQLASRKRNDGRTEGLGLTESARCPPTDLALSAHDADTVRRLSGLEEEVSGLEEEVSGLRDEVDRWRGKAEEAGQRAARAEGEKLWKLLPRGRARRGRTRAR